MKTTATNGPTGFLRVPLHLTSGIGPSSESRHSAVTACVSSGRSPIGPNLRSGTRVAVPRCRGRLSLTRRLRCCDPTLQMPSHWERDFGGQYSCRWTTIPNRIPVRSSKATVPRLRGKSYCTATSGRPKTAGPFPASPIPSWRRSQAIGDMRIRWNRAAMRRFAAPFAAERPRQCELSEIDERAARRLLDGGRRLRTSVKKPLGLWSPDRHWLLPIVAAGGVQWKALNADSRATFFPSREWSQATEDRSQAVRGLLRRMHGRCRIHRRRRSPPWQDEARRLDQRPPQPPAELHSGRCVRVHTISAVD